MNSLRRPNRSAELGLQIILAFLFGILVLVSSGGFLAGTIGLLNVHRPDLLDLLLWAVFLVWQFAPILFEGYSPGLDFREVARYPVSFRLYFLLSSAYGLSDPAAVTAMLWLLSIWLGIIIARPGWTLTAAIALLLFAIFNLLLNRWIIGLFDRFQSTRKGRERMVFLTLMFIIVMNLVQVNASSLATRKGFRIPAWVGQAVSRVREFSPPGMASRIFTIHGATALVALGGLLLCACLAYFLLRRQLHGIYLGDIYEETHVVRRKRKIHTGWRMPLTDEVTSAIIEKELRYLQQSARLILQLIYPPIIFLVLASNGPGWKKLFAGRHDAVLAGMAGFILLSVPNLSYNIFGMDKEGFGRWLLSPLPLQKVFLAKNLAHGGMLLLIYLVVAVGVVAVFHIGLIMVLTVTVAFCAVLVIQLCVGNLMSVHWPKRIELSRMNSRMASSTAGLTSVLAMIPLSAIIGAVIFASWYWHFQWLPLLCAVIALAASLKGYSLVLAQVSRYTWEHVEEITGNLGA